MKYLVVSDRPLKQAATDFLANQFEKVFGADIIYTKSDFEKTTLKDRVLNKINFELDKANINKRLLEACQEKCYDCVFILKGNRVRASTLKKIKKINPGCIVAAYSGDNMSLWLNRSWAFTRSIPAYDIFFITNIPAYKKFERFRPKNIYYFDKRADKLLHKPLHQKRLEFLYDVIFIGTYECDRARILNKLAGSGIRVTIFGNNWERAKITLHPSLDVKFKELVGQDYVDAIYRSKITLGFLRKINSDTQTSRSFEIPAIGGFALLERTEDHQRLFLEDQEVVLFGNTKELITKIKFYLDHDDIREKIAVNGYERVRKSGYYFDSLVRDIHSKILEMSGRGNFGYK